MNIGMIIGIAGGAVGVIGVIYTVYYGRRGQKKRLMVYEVSGSVALAQAFSPEDDYKLSVLFERKGSSEEKIESVYTTFLKFVNLGKEAIRGNDIAPANPLRVTIKGARVLDIQVAGITREVNNVYLRDQVIKNEEASAGIGFDFLDYQDGALVKILSVGNSGKISVEGDIIGMPEGIKDIEEIRPTTKGGGGGVVWFMGVFVGGSALSAFIFYWVVGNWGNVWLIFVPVGVWVLLFGTLLMIGDRPWSRRPEFPKSLELPEWCRPFVPPMMMMRTALLEMEMRETEMSRNLRERKGKG